MLRAKNLTLANTLPYILLIGGIIGVICAGMLTYEKIAVLQNPGAALNCNLNPVVACGPVINKPQAAVFGFPNPFIGLVAFAAVATIGAAILAGAKFKRWFWLGLELGSLLGVIFVSWLQFQTIYRIQALCPYCMVTWAVTIPIFWFTTLYNLKMDHLKVPDRLKGATDFVQKHQLDLLILWFLVIILAIGSHFWYYWRTLI